MISASKVKIFTENFILEIFQPNTEISHVHLYATDEASELCKWFAM